jgi:hypothetical protein
MKTYYKNLPLDAGVGDAPDRVVPGDHLKAFLFMEVWLWIKKSTGQRVGKHGHSRKG